MLIDISELGALVQLPVPQTIDAPITLELEWEHATLQLAGRVVRSSPSPAEEARMPAGVTDYYVAVEFASVPHQLDTALKKMLGEN
jgi:hypothetical protein